jgi:hypothetical protein
MNIRCLDGDDKLFRNAAHRRGGGCRVIRRSPRLGDHLRISGGCSRSSDRALPDPDPVARRRGRRLARPATPGGADRAALWGFAASVAGTWAWFLWLARPDFLPTGSGPDLAHHLSLLEYIQRHWRLVHDVALSEYLGEMIDYTPGSHLLAVLTGAWFQTDALHAVYPTVAGTVALKAGLIFLITLRLLPRGAPRVASAAVAVILLFLPRAHFVGSFTEQSYLAQVVSELFAVAMWWALVVWDEHPSPGPMVGAAVAGVATFLCWPVWIGPLLVVLAALALLHGELPLVRRAQRLAIRRSRSPPSPPSTDRGTSGGSAWPAPAGSRSGRPWECSDGGSSASPRPASSSAWPGAARASSRCSWPPSRCRRPPSLAPRTRAAPPRRTCR